MRQSGLWYAVREGNVVIVPCLEYVIPPPFEKVLNGAHDWTWERREPSLKQLNVEPESTIMQLGAKT